MTHRHLESSIGLHLGEHRIRGDHHQHGGKLRGEHAGPLRHATNGVFATVVGGFRLRVSCHDREGRVLSAILRELRTCPAHPAPDRIHIQQFADEAGGANGNISGCDLQLSGHQMSRGYGIRVARFAGARVCTAGVEGYGAQLVIRHRLPSPFHRSSVHTVRGRDSRSHVVWAVIDDDGEVPLSTVLQAAGNASRRESKG